MVYYDIEKTLSLMEKNDEEIEKWQLFTAAGVAIVVIGTGSVMMFSHPSTPDQAITKETPMVQTVKDGSIASSVLLTGKVTANQEQYVYFDGTKGICSRFWSMSEIK